MLIPFRKKHPGKNSPDPVGMEYCVLCGGKTIYTIDTPISERECYVEGAGQLCSKCFREIYLKY